MKHPPVAAHVPEHNWSLSLRGTFLSQLSVGHAAHPSGTRMVIKPPGDIKIMSGSRSGQRGRGWNRQLTERRGCFAHLF